MPVPHRELLPFQRVQHNFAAYIRDPQSTSLTFGVEERRMKVYARLFYNNVESFLRDAFPVFRKLIDDARWHALVRDFMHRHRAASPYFSRIPEEFLEYLSTPDRHSPATPPFALELCHFEWVRLALARAPDADCDFDDSPIGIDDQIALSPLAWPLRYAYPVRRLSADYQPRTAPTDPTYLIAYRDRHDDVRFTTANAVTTRLLALVAEGRNTRDCLATVARELGSPVEDVEGYGLATVNRLHQRDIVVRAKLAS